MIILVVLSRNIFIIWKREKMIYLWIKNSWILQIWQMYRREGYSPLLKLVILNNSLIRYYSTLWNERRNAHHYLLLCIRGIGRFLLLFNKAHHQNNAPAYLNYVLPLGTFISWNLQTMRQTDNFLFMVHICNNQNIEWFVCE